MRVGWIIKTTKGYYALEGFTPSEEKARPYAAFAHALQARRELPEELAAEVVRMSAPAAAAPLANPTAPFAERDPRYQPKPDEPTQPDEPSPRKGLLGFAAKARRK